MSMLLYDSYIIYLKLVLFKVKEKIKDGIKLNEKEDQNEKNIPLE